MVERGAGGPASDVVRPASVKPVALEVLADRYDLVVDAPGGSAAVIGATLRAQEAADGDLFAGLAGSRVHGASFAAQAVAAGAAAVLTDPAGLALIRADESCRSVPVLVHDDPRSVLGRIAAQIYGHPSRKMTLIGITGTSGKTTTAYLTEAALRAAGRVVGLVGTVEIRVDGTAIRSSLTTPEAPDLQRLFAVMVERGVDTVVMEVSSHALSLGRVDGSQFAIGGFTNLSQDHLDYHRTMAEYFAAKARLFSAGESTRAARAVICIDDAWGEEMAEVARGGGGSVHTVATRGDADWSVIESIGGTAGSQTVRIAGPAVTAEMTVPLPGTYNVANALLAVSLCAEAGVDPAVAIEGLGAVAVPGRLEKVDRGQRFLAVVDYAHKPAAVEAVLETLRSRLSGRIAVVLGAGGDRDTEKRPLMGAAAVRGADLVIVTDDNPRSEDPDAIRAAVLAGARAVDAASRRAVDIRDIGDRRAAISAAVDWAGADDVVLIAGKGHETGQEVRGVKHPFDDREILAEAIAARRSDVREPVRILPVDPAAGVAAARRRVRDLVALAADLGAGSAHRGDGSRRTWAILTEFTGPDGVDENLRCIEHDGLGRQLVRLAVDKVIAVGDQTRTVRALHQGAVMEGSWGDEAVLTGSAAAAVDRARAVPTDGPGPGDLVLLSSGEVGDAFLAYWRDEAGLPVETVFPPGSDAD
ncbi:UDP-N-acetylmuramoyl-L-alanyl-D-glutamate--2,6-diaminopimelate ligase [Gordonia shandongensis]|uniref:UDP-N-acetylmuramoyl-L-alanyl-D-glutamate--2, 6-diaminopimelate ligase n=1 Tax=Gordonia shandongensis TaxID=376351 RepID=UPI000411E645